MIQIIIPVYNAARYLRECLDSLFDQTFQGFCVGCVDDGSTDGSLNILESYASKHSNMRVLHTNNFGPSHARNLALDAFVNDKISWIMFLDADDVLEPNYLEDMVEAQIRSNADIVCSSFQFYKGAEKSKFLLMGDQKELLTGYDAAMELLSDHTIQSHSPCKLYRASVWNGTRYPEHIVAMEDQGTVFKTFCKARTVYIDPLITGYLYRQTGHSICSSQITNKRVLDSIEGYSIPCFFDYPGLSEDQRAKLISTAKQSLAVCYLMMFPRFLKRKATKEERDRWNMLSRAIRREKIIKKYIPLSKKEKWKKKVFLYARPLYGFMYRMLVARR